MTVNQLIKYLQELKEQGMGDEIVLDADGYAASSPSLEKADMELGHGEWGFDEGDRFVQIGSCR